MSVKFINLDMVMLRVKLHGQQVVVFALTWVAYASTYLLRKPLGVVKTDLSSELSMTKAQLGWLDTALLLPYAAVQICLGSLGDRFGARRTLGMCLILSSLSMVSFGYWKVFYMLCLQLFLNGAAQSLAWPSCTKILGQYFSGEERTSLFGLWGTCVFAGGIVATTLAVYLRAHYNWQMAFFLPSIFVGVVGIMVLLILREPPRGIPIHPMADEPLASQAEKSSPSSLPLNRLWSMPLVKEAAVGTFTTKLVRYCMIMWLPLYLQQELNYNPTDAGLYSVIFEVGGVLGSATIGVIISRLFRGRTWQGISACILLAALSFAGFYTTSQGGRLLSQSFMLLAGACNCGVDPILTGAIPSALGEMGGSNAQASVAGFINGVGTLGTILEGPIIGLVTQAFGWQSMLHLMVALSLVGAMATYRGHTIQMKR